MSGLQSTGAPPVSDSSTLPRGRYTTAGELKRQTALGLSASGGLGHAETRSAKRTSSTVSITSIGYRGDDRRRHNVPTKFTILLVSLFNSQLLCLHSVVSCHYIILDLACLWHRRAVSQGLNTVRIPLYEYWHAHIRKYVLVMKLVTTGLTLRSVSL